MLDRSSERDFRQNIRPSTPEEREEFLSYFRETLNVISGVANGGWWVVGGVARDAIVNRKAFTVKQSDGEWRDLDLITSGEVAKAILARMRFARMPLHVGMSMNTTVRAGEEWRLGFGRIRMAVPKQAFETVFLRLGDVEFPSFSPQTLLHLYCAGERPGGRMRDKDYLNVWKLAEYIRVNPDPNFPESLYRSFHQFSHQKNGRKSFEQFAMDMAIAYRNSPANRYLPINHPAVLPLVERVWEFIDRESSKRVKLFES